MTAPIARCCRSEPRCARCPARFAAAVRARRSGALAALVEEMLVPVPDPVPEPVAAALAALAEARRRAPLVRRGSAGVAG